MQLGGERRKSRDLEGQSRQTNEKIKSIVSTVPFKFKAVPFQLKTGSSKSFTFFFNFLLIFTKYKQAIMKDKLLLTHAALLFLVIVNVTEPQCFCALSRMVLCHYQTL